MIRSFEVVEVSEGDALTSIAVIIMRGQAFNSHLYQPWLHVIIDNNVEPVDFKAMSIRIHDPADGFERMDNLPVDVVKELVRHRVAHCGGEVEAETLERPLAAVLRIVIVGVFLDGDVCEVNEEVVEFGCALVVTHRAKAAKSHFVNVRLEWPKGCDKNINAQIKLLSTNQQRVPNVAGNNVCFPRCRDGKGRLRLARPLFQLGQFVDQENADSASFTARFHYPKSE